MNRHLGNILLMQFSKHEARLERLGIYNHEMENGEFEYRINPIDGLKKNRELTNALDSIINYNAALTLRAKSFQTHFIPTHKSVMSLVNSWGYLNRKSKDSKMIKDALETLYERVVLGTTKGVIGEDEKKRKITVSIPGGKQYKVDVEAILNSTGRVFANAMLGLSPTQYIKEGGGLIGELYAFGYNNSMTEDGLFTHKEIAPAVKFIGENELLVDKINEAYLAANKSEKDMIGGRWNVASQQSLFESDTLHLATSYTNYRARKIIMIAQMMKDGSLDAHSLKEVILPDGRKDLVLNYDQTKDDRFAENGKITEDGEKIMRVMRQNLIDTKFSINGKFQRDSDKLLAGYDFRNSRRFKGMADMFVTGAQSSDTLPPAMSYGLARSLMTFRNFSLPKMQRLLIGSGKTAEIGEYRVVNGAVEYWAPEFKSVLSSYSNAVKKFMDGKRNPAQIWNSLDDADRKNLRQNLLDITMYFMTLAAATGGTYVLYYILTGLDVTDEEKDPENGLKITDKDTAYQVMMKGITMFFVDAAHKIAKEMTADAFHLGVFYDFLEDPFPATGYITNMVDLIYALTQIREMEDLETVAKKTSYQIPGTRFARDLGFTYTTLKRIINQPINEE